MFLFNTISHQKTLQKDFQRDHFLEVKMCFYHTSLLLHTHTHTSDSQVVSVAVLLNTIHLSHTAMLKIIQCLNNTKWKRQSILKV